MTDRRPGTAALCDRVLRTVEPRGEGREGPAYVCVRRGGRRLAEAWGEGARWATALAAALDAALRQTTGAVDQVEVSLAHSFRALESPPWPAALANAHRGVTGVELSLGERRERFAPIAMIARNQGFQKVVERFALEAGLLPSARLGEDLGARAFEAEERLVRLPEGSVTALVRGSRTVSLAEVTRERVRAAARAMGGWLAQQVHADGRMTYLYWPSRGRESDTNNLIRQAMATIALARFAAFEGDPALADLAEKNLAYNLERFYRTDGTLGWLELHGKAKLGAAALFALAIVESPARARFATHEAALCRLVEHLHQPDGSFRTFFLPAGRDDNQNFYPGEALCLWAELDRRAPDQALRERFHRSFRHYRAWHRANPNPAFVPWHTRAYASMWDRTGERALAGAVLSMNDWLLGRERYPGEAAPRSMQQWEDAPHPDMRGRFHDPARRRYGPPHASSTGVYLEGLADALRVARALGDAPRAAAYEVAIRRGLRSVLQLQLAEDAELFYLRQPARVRGGVRTTVYDNTLRIDNAQHCLLACLQLLTDPASDPWADA